MSEQPRDDQGRFVEQVPDVARRRAEGRASRDAAGGVAGLV